MCRLFLVFSFLLSLSFSACAEELLSFAKAVKAAAPAVVNIYIAGPADSPENDPDQKRTNYRLGSGVIINKQGYILSNYHVASQAKAILVMLPDGRKIPAKVIGSDPEVDLAVLKISAENIHPITLGDTKNLQVGDLVLAIGNPYGLGQTVTHGIISAMGRNTAEINQIENYIQIDAAINPGNSGGALVNSKGQLIGITVGIYSRSGGFQGLGFAIPSDVALNIMQQIIQTGKVQRAYLGVNVADVSQGRGAEIVQVMPHSPAEKAGLKMSDVILSVNNFSIEDSRSFQNYIAQRSPGTNLILKIRRKDKVLEFSIKSAVRPRPPILDDRGQPHLKGEKKDLPDHIG